MSSETKSRVGRTAEQVVNEWRESGSQDWGQLVSAINYWAVTDMCPALESSSQGGPFSESLKKSSRDCVWIVEQNGRVHSIHSTHESAMKEQGENLRIGVPWQVLPWATPAPVTTPGRDEALTIAILTRKSNVSGHSNASFAHGYTMACDDILKALAAAKVPRA